MSGLNLIIANTIGSVVKLGAFLAFLVRWAIWTEDEQNYFISEDEEYYFISEEY